MFASPVLPFAGSVKLIRRAGSAALDLPGLPRGWGIQKAGGAIWGHAEIRGKFTHFPSIHMINITILKNHMGIAMRRF